MLLSLLPRISSHAAAVFTASRTQPRPIRSFHPRIVGSTFQSGKWTNVASIVALALPYETCFHFSCFSPSMCGENSTNATQRKYWQVHVSWDEIFFRAVCFSWIVDSFRDTVLYIRYVESFHFFFFLTTPLVKCYCSLRDNENTTQGKSSSDNGGDTVNCSIKRLQRTNHFKWWNVPKLYHYTTRN